MMVLRDLQNTINLRKGNKAHTREPAIPEYTVNQNQNLIKEVVHAEERFSIVSRFLHNGNVELTLQGCDTHSR